RRIGLALSDPTGVATQMLPDVRRHGDDPRAAQEVAEVAHRYEVRTIVVGLPLRLDGTEGPQAQAARRFARLLERTAALPVRLWDERLTSVQADPPGRRTPPQTAPPAAGSSGGRPGAAQLPPSTTGLLRPTPRGADERTLREVS
ncbi:MAG: Holliday junction resolvase RuvX, partial [candidate division GAL15 bacterium]